MIAPRERAPRANACGEIGRLDVAVVGMTNGTDQAVGDRQRPDFPDLLGRQELDVDADRAGDAGVLAVLVHAVGRHGETDVADGAQPDVLSGFLLQGAVQVHRVLVNLAHGVAHVEQRQKPGRMPRGSGRQLLALEEDRIGPTLAREVVEGGDADHATADDHGAGVLRHANRSIRFSSTPRPGRCRRPRCPGLPDGGAARAWS